MERPQIIIDAEAKEAGPYFMDLPERWFEKPHWRCPNGHVSTHYIKSERLRRSACQECDGPLWLTFPEDKDDPSKG